MRAVEPVRGGDEIELIAAVSGDLARLRVSPMENISIRVNPETYDSLRALAAESGTTLKAILEEAVKQFYEKRYWKQYYDTPR